MPVRRYTPTPSAEYTELLDRLSDEWRTPDVAAAEPVILEEADRQGVVRHVYVIWDDWSHLPSSTRGEIIMDAAQRTKQQHDVDNITIAMGLTAAEADRFQLKCR